MFYRAITNVNDNASLSGLPNNAISQSFSQDIKAERAKLDTQVALAKLFKRISIGNGNKSQTIEVVARQAARELMKTYPRHQKFVMQALDLDWATAKGPNLAANKSLRKAFELEIERCKPAAMVKARIFVDTLSKSLADIEHTSSQVGDQLEKLSMVLLDQFPWQSQTIINQLEDLKAIYSPVPHPSDSLKMEMLAAQMLLDKIRSNMKKYGIE